jgi:mono/diheme cytochrome c family protein
MKLLYFLPVLLHFFDFSNDPTTTSFHTNYTSQNPLQKSILAGKEIYQDFCVRCHLADGKGSATVPPLAQSDWLVNKRKESIHAVKFGQSGKITVNGKLYQNAMPPMGLTDEEVADVMNYIMNQWGNKQSKMVTVEEVAKVQK